MSMDYDTKNTDRLNPSRLIVDRQSSALKQLLWHLVRSAKESDVLAPVTVVGPTRYANLSLRHEFGRGGFANVRFIVMPVLSELLGAAALAREGRRPLTAVLESVSLRQVMAQTTGPLAPVREHQTTQASVRASFRELRRADEGVLTTLERQGGVRGEIIRLYRDFRRNTVSDWYDVEDLAEAASDAVRKGEASGLAELGLIVFYLPRNTTSAETKLIEALARQDRCAVLLGTTGEDEADTSALTVAAALKPMLGEPRAASAISRLPLLPGEARLHIAPNAHEELRWVIRRITQEAEEQRTPFHRMAILYRMDNPYTSLIRDELHLAGIPMAGPGRETLAGTAVGRTLTGLLGLPGGEFRRAEVMDWLTGCPVRPHIGHVADFNPSRWDSITRKAGIVRGLDQWRNRLNLHAKQLTEEAARQAKAEEITEARAGRMRAEAAAARNALAFVEKLGEDVEPPENGSLWGAFCDWANQLLEHYLAHDIPEAESVALDKIRRALEELRVADNIRAETTLDEFRQTIEDSLRAPMGHLGVTGQGVFVSTIAAATGMSFDAVWLVGMIEGGTPPGVRPDPLLPESDWRAAGGLSRFAQRIAAERYDYLSAVAASPHRELSYPVADAASWREAYPSRWFLAVGHVQGKAHTGGGDGGALPHPLLPRLHGAGRGQGRRAADGRRPEPPQAHLRRLQRPSWQADKSGPARYPLADYIKHRMKGFFDLLIGDKVHEFKGRGSAQGIAAGILADVCGKSLSLTGTLLGGYSSTIFHLLYRFSPEIRTEFGRSDEHRWIQRYGFEEVTIGKPDDDAVEDGRNSRRRSYRKVIRERPGLVPSALFHIIGNTVFLRLADVASGLPDYEEKILMCHAPCSLRSSLILIRARRPFSVGLRRGIQNRGFRNNPLATPEGRPWQRVSEESRSGPPRNALPL